MLEVVELNHSLVRKASPLLANYRFEGGWGDQELEECTSALLRLLDYNHAFCLLARNEGEYLGFVTYHWGFSTTKGMPILKIQDVFTLPKHRRSGVARALLRHTIDLAVEQGAHRLQLETDTDNIPARKLYSNLGFKWISQKEVYMLPLCQWDKPIFGEKSEKVEYERRIGCYAVILDSAQAQIAVILTSKGHYFLPGGGMEDGESLEDCLRREVLEETGYEIQVNSYIGEAQRYFITAENEPILSDGEFYLAEIIKKVQESIEKDHYLKWVNIENVADLLFHEHHAWAVKRASSKLQPLCFDRIDIREIDLNRTEIAELVSESLNEGHHHISRLLEDYQSGRNRFSEEGEVLFGAFINDRLIGICGLNQDPYLNDKGIGRVRRLYVLKAFRRCGVGRKLMDAIIQAARKHYTMIVLRTDHPVADRFYRTIGFSDQSKYNNSTHHLKLNNEKWHRHLGAYGIYLSEGKLLVIHKGSGPYIGRYDLPGGTVEAHESLTEAVRREFIEEAGIKIQIEKRIGVCDYLIPYELPKRGTTHIHHVAILYLVQYIEGSLAINPEQFEGQDSLGAVWIPIRDFTSHNSSPLVLQAIEWLRTGKLPFEAQLLYDWVVLK